MFKSQISTILRLDAQSRNYFRGVFAIDELSKQLKQPGAGAAYVVNYDERDKPGSHWVGVFRDDQGHVDFFDSVGLPPLDDRITRYVLGSNYSFNPNQYQQLSGNACGFYVVYFILQRSRHCTANDILEHIDRVNSDYVVKDYIYSRFKPIFK